MGTRGQNWKPDFESHDDTNRLKDYLKGEWQRPAQRVHVIGTGAASHAPIGLGQRPSSKDMEPNPPGLVRGSSILVRQQPCGPVGPLRLSETSTLGRTGESSTLAVSRRTSVQFDNGNCPRLGNLVGIIPIIHLPTTWVC